MNRFIKVIAILTSIASCHASLLVLNDSPRVHQGNLRARFQDQTTTNTIELDLVPDRMSGIYYFLSNQGSRLHHQDPLPEPELGSDLPAYCQELNNFLTNRYTAMYARYERYTYRYGNQEYDYQREDDFVDPVLSGRGLEFLHHFEWLDNDDERRSEAFLELTYEPLGEEQQQTQTRRLFSRNYTVSNSYSDTTQTWYQWTGQRLQKMQRNLLSGSLPTISGIEGLARNCGFNDLPVFQPINNDYVPGTYRHVRNHVSELQEDTVFPAQDRGARLIQNGIYQVLGRRSKKSPFLYRQNDQVQLVRHSVWHLENPLNSQQFDMHLPEKTEQRLDLGSNGLEMFIHGNGLYCLHGDYVYHLNVPLQTNQTGQQWDWDRVNGVSLNGEYTASRLVKDLYSRFLKGRLEISDLTFANANEINQLVSVLRPHLNQDGQLLPANRQLNRLTLTNTYLPYASAVVLNNSNQSLEIHGKSQEEQDLYGQINNLQNQVSQIATVRSGLINLQQVKIGQRPDIEKQIRAHTNYKNWHAGQVNKKTKQLKKLKKKDPNPKKKIKAKKQQVQHQQSMVQGNIGYINSYNGQLAQVNSEISSLQTQINQRNSDHRARDQELQTARQNSQDIRARSNYPFVRQ